MTKKRIILFISFLLITGLFYFLRGSALNPKLEVDSSKSSSKYQKNINVEKLEIDGKKVIGLSPGHEKEEIKNIKISNVVSEEWKPNLEKTLLLQGGPSVKDLVIKKVDSFVWAQDGMALFVESVIVSLKNENNAETTFRVLVDAQNGKILKNWDQPTIDMINPKDSYKIKVDPTDETE